MSDKDSSATYVVEDLALYLDTLTFDFFVTLASILSWE